MATVWVRYSDGDEASWDLTDALAAALQDFAAKMIHASFERDLFSFPVVSDEGARASTTASCRSGGRT